MALRLKEVVAAGLWLFLAAAMIYTLCGCTVTLKDKGNVFLRFGTETAVGHETSATQATSEASTDIDKGLKNWMWDDEENEQTIENPDIADLPDPDRE